MCLVFNYLHPTGSPHGGYMKYYILAQEIKVFLLLHLLFYYRIGFPQKNSSAGITCSKLSLT